MKRLIAVAVTIVVVSVVGLTACSSEGPAVKAARKMAAAANDERKANDIRDGAGPQIIRCDAGTKNLVFFDSITDNALVFYRKDENTRRISCYDRHGYDRRSGKMLRPVTAGVVDEILEQPAPPAPTAPWPIVVAPAPAPTPLPQLGEGPCCGR